MRSTLFASLLGAGLFITSSASATSYTVNSNADPAAECVANGQLTLREAVTAANENAACGDASAGGAADSITFSLAPGARIIALKGTLRVTAPLTMDGAGTVELVGEAAGAGAIGVELFRHIGSTVRGLTVRGFARSGVEVTCFAFSDIPCGSHVITGNRIGTDVTGMLARPNGFGVFVFGGFETVIGGDTAAERNVISGNTNIAVYLLAGATVSRVEGNFIGVAANGLTALPNHGEAGVVFGGGVENTLGGDLAHGNVIAGNTRIQVAVYGNGADASGHVIAGNLIGVGADGVTPIQGGSAAFAGMPAVDISGDQGMRAYSTSIGGDPAHRNVIGNQGFGGDGIRIGAFAEQTVVRANFIGTSATGNADFGNAGYGVQVLVESSTTYLGSEGPNGTNVIAHNTLGGVRIQGGTGARLFREAVRANRGPGVRVSPGAQAEIVETMFADNAGLGIDVGASGVTAGAPTITHVAPSEISLTVTGEPGANVRVELFLASFPADESGHGEARVFLGAEDTLLDGSGSVALTITPARALDVGESVTATATIAGVTTEHARNVTLAAPGSDAGVPVEDAGSEDAGVSVPADASSADAGADADASEVDANGAGPARRDAGGCSAGGGGAGNGAGAVVLIAIAVGMMRRRT